MTTTVFLCIAVCGLVIWNFVLNYDLIKTNKKFDDQIYQIINPPKYKMGETFISNKYGKCIVLEVEFQSCPYLGRFYNYKFYCVKTKEIHEI